MITDESREENRDMKEKEKEKGGILKEISNEQAIRVRRI